MNHEEFAQLVQDRYAWTKSLKSEMSNVLVGQDQLVDRLIIGLLSNGHIILEGVPGLAKTLAINSLAGCLDTGFSRIQFTPDLMPGDVSGSLVYDARTGEFEFREGPVFTHVVLAGGIPSSASSLSTGGRWVGSTTSCFWLKRMMSPSSSAI